jgi:hypothetical protein
MHVSEGTMSDQARCRWGTVYAFTPVGEHMGWVRNVVLMSVYLGLEKPQGVRIPGGGARWADEGKQGSVYEQPKEEVDGSCHSKEGSK